MKWIIMGSLELRECFICFLLSLHVCDVVSVFSLLHSSWEEALFLSTEKSSCKASNQQGVLSNGN